jgi:hypothetical protein
MPSRMTLGKPGPDSWVALGPAISGNALLVGAWDANLCAFSER